MNKKQALTLIESRIEELGIPKHLVHIRKVPSSVECSLVVGHQHIQFSASAGVSEMDLERNLQKIASAWHSKIAGGKQVDLEDAIEAAE
jgi:hypothetical protein